MKLAGQQAENALKSIAPAVRLILLFGPDEGLVHERARQAVRVAADGVTDDPFRISLLAGGDVQADPARLGDEAAALCLMGGRRVVWVKAVNDAAGGSVLARHLADPVGEALIVVEAGDLTKRSELRRTAEASPAALAIGCYPDGERDLTETISRHLAEHRIAIDPDAMASLRARLNGARVATRSELDKLITYVGDARRIGVGDIEAVIGDGAEAVLSEAAEAAADGALVALSRLLDRVFSSGESPVGLIRVALRHFQRLHAAASLVATGKPQEVAIAALRPPPFPRDAQRLGAQLKRWNPTRLSKALALLAEAERACKTAHLPDQTIAADVMLALARMAAQPRVLKR